ncbi:MAG TPA: ATP phosphoribosyltransferase regulatory subunit [Spongiibacteraceae bacterium]|nr:ATP phosphoribosyltransferase regulatory subunit [Spongiibacteraceae bacterium]
MTIADRWLLPDGVEELLPAQAERAEQLRRRLLDLFRSWGYRLVMPSLLEFTDSLLVGLGSDVDLLTFKVTDQLSGRTMGIRADITPQVARIDAHSLRQDGPVRLCYAGSVLHTRPKSLMASRSPIQIGVELYGDAGLASDSEVVLLMLQTLNTAGLHDVTLDVGHVGIYRALVQAAVLSAGDEQELFDALQRKAGAEIAAVLQRAVRDERVRGWLLALSQLQGDLSVLVKARTDLAGAPTEVHAALDELVAVAAIVQARLPAVRLYFDLSELRGYHYHTGLVFAALVPGWGQAVANGGRYDHVGEVFGRARPATGFSTDLKALIALAGNAEQDTAGAIVAPCDDDPELWQVMQSLRAAGEQVIAALPQQPAPENCDRQLVRRDGRWQVVALSTPLSNGI